MPENTNDENIGYHDVSSENRIDERALVKIKAAMLGGALEIIARRVHGGGYDVLIVTRPE